MAAQGARLPLLPPDQNSAPDTVGYRPRLADTAIGHEQNAAAHTGRRLRHLPCGGDHLPGAARVA
jgi:hypothetical protein